MTISNPTLIWLFPVAFMLHDFEEVILFEPWLKVHAPEIKTKLQGRIPAFMAKQIDVILTKTTPEFALPVCLFFLFTAASSFVAVEYGRYGFFLAASTAYFLHGFMHIGQAAALRRYVPSLLTSILIVIPYGCILFARLLGAGIVTWPGLLLYGLLGLVTIVPLIMLMHRLGDRLFHSFH
jgi:hypothetical protein